MVKKIFSKNYCIVLILLLITVALALFLFILGKPKVKLEKKEVLSSTALDFTLKARLAARVEKALFLYSKKGWGETRKLLEDVMWECKKGGCNPEIFFNESLDSLAAVLSNNQEFTYAGRTLGIIYPGNWELADIDGDGKNEVVVLQRDALNVNYTLLKVIDFQEDSRVSSYKLEGLGYLSSPNSSGEVAPIKILDLTGDTVPEIILFLSSGRGGAQLFVFRYHSTSLKLVLKKDDLSYPEYTLSDVDKDGVLEVGVEGYSPKRGEKIREILNL